MCCVNRSVSNKLIHDLMSPSTLVQEHCHPDDGGHVFDSVTLNHFMGPCVANCR